MKITVIATMWNEEYILPFFFRHYDPHVDEYILFDNVSTDRTPGIARSNAKAKVTVHDTSGRQDHEWRANTFSALHKSLDADWFICVDTDEFLWHPDGLRKYLGSCAARGITVPQTQGWNMLSRDTPIDDGRTPMTSLVREGARWDPFHLPFTGDAPIPLTVAFIYDKCAAFASGVDIRYGIGEHYAACGRGCVHSATRELYLLHYKWVGLERTIQKRLNMRVRYPGGKITVRGQADEFADRSRKWFEMAMSHKTLVVT